MFKILMWNGAALCGRLKWFALLWRSDYRPGGIAARVAWGAACALRPTWRQETENRRRMAQTLAQTEAMLSRMAAGVE